MTSVSPNRFVVAYARAIFFVLLTLYMVPMLYFNVIVWVLWEIAAGLTHTECDPAWPLGFGMRWVDRATTNLNRNTRYSHRTNPMRPVPCKVNPPRPRMYVVKSEPKKKAVR